MIEDIDPISLACVALIVFVTFGAYYRWVHIKQNKPINPHPESCCVNPIDLTWNKKISPGENATICGDCFIRIHVRGL